MNLFLNIEKILGYESFCLRDIDMPSARYTGT